METKGVIGTLDVHAVEEQHTEVDVQIPCAAKTLDKGDCACPGRVTRKACLPAMVLLDFSADTLRFEREILPLLRRMGVKS